MYSIFNFSPTEAISHFFKEFGYEETNFIGLTGGLLINLLIAVITFMLIKLLTMIAIQFKDHRTCRKVGMRLS